MAELTVKRRGAGFVCGGGVSMYLALLLMSPMKKSSIQFEIELDDKNVPERIRWDATEKPEAGLSETKAISLSLWDHQQKNTLRIDLWAKDMPVEEMKRFYIDCIGGLAQSVLTSTGDEVMAAEMNAVCDRLAEHLRTENKGQ
jgi:gliding motility-associated protein GldC